MRPRAGGCRWGLVGGEGRISDIPYGAGVLRVVMLACQLCQVPRVQRTTEKWQHVILASCSGGRRVMINDFEGRIYHETAALEEALRYSRISSESIPDRHAYCSC